VSGCPVVGGLWLGVGVEQQFTAERAASVLAFQLGAVGSGDFMELPAQSLEICEALATIQKHSYLPVRIPDLANTLVSEVNEWLHVARLLRGDAIELNWEDIYVQVHEGLVLSSDAFTVATADKLSVTVGELEIDLGYKMYHLEAARVDADDPEPRDGLTRLIPAGSDRGTVRWWGMTPPELESS
jgi:hypothetical protein